MAKKIIENAIMVANSDNQQLEVANCDFILRSQNVTSKTRQENHISTSIKDLGKKWFAFTLMRDMTATELINKIQQA